MSRRWSLSRAETVTSTRTRDVSCSLGTRWRWCSCFRSSSWGIAMLSSSGSFGSAPNSWPRWLMETGQSMPPFASLGVSSLIAMFMGPTWCPSGADRSQVAPMLAPWTLLSGLSYSNCVCVSKVWTNERKLYIHNIFSDWLRTFQDT